jgi:hypothetical protein
MQTMFTRETPQARVEWHLACIEARRRGDREPTPPWEKQTDTLSQERFNELSLPARPLVQTTSQSLKSAPSRLRQTAESDPEPSTLHTKEKELAIEYLLLRAGVPRDTIKKEGRVAQIFEAYTTFVSRRGESDRSALLHKYEIGRHFLTHGGVHEAIALSEAILPLLAATSATEVSSRERYLHRAIDTLAAPRNFAKHRV